MMDCCSREDAVIIANKYWDDHKSDREFISLYINSEITLPITVAVEDQKKLTTFFKKTDSTLNNKPKNTPTNHSDDNHKVQSEENTTPVIKRKVELISGERPHKFLFKKQKNKPFI